MRKTNCCHSFLAYNLKFLNFLQFFVGICIIIYSVYILNQWQNRSPIFPPPAPSPNPSIVAANQIEPFNVAVRMVSGLEEEVHLYVNQLPAPWFIYAFMGVGVVLCCVSCVGHIGAEVINGFCLCFYTTLIAVLLLIEGALVAFVVIDHNWQKELPSDSTGELHKLVSFIEENADICKWIGIALLVIQASTLLLAIILRAMVSTRREDSDIEDDYDSTSGRMREPLLNSPATSQSSPFKSEARETMSDIWSARMRKKYGLNDEHKNRLQNQNV